MAGGKLYEITGADREAFLQGLVSNDLKKLDQGLVYAALLTPQGKYLADFFILRHDDAIILDVAPVLAESLVRRLTMYRLRAQIGIAESALTVARSETEGLADPRHPALGCRTYGENLHEAPRDWDAIRVAHCIPESGIELVPDESYLLESGFERLNGVDFRKGCYVGQEVTARMKHKTELRKGLVTIDIEGGPVPVGTPIEAGGKPAGTLFTQSGGQAIAYLRFDRAQGPMQAAGTALHWTGTVPAQR